MIVLLGGLLVGAGLLVAIVGRSMANQRRVRDLRTLLDVQALSPSRPEDAEETSSLLARSGVVAERALGEANVLTRIRLVLDRSDWTLSPGEFVVVSVVVGGLAALLVTATVGLIAGIVLGVVAATAPYALVLRSVTKRRSAFDQQFPDVLDVIAASLESGASVTHALQAVVDEADQPAAGEFARVLTATRMGASLPEALAEAAERVGSKDLDWTVTAVTVQQRTGGKLAEILRIVARTMRERAEIGRELAALTAEGRLSAYILGALPFGITAMLLVMRPGYLRPLFSDPVGYLLVGVASVLMLLAFVWMRRIVRVEV